MFVLKTVGKETIISFFFLKRGGGRWLPLATSLNNDDKDYDDGDFYDQSSPPPPQHKHLPLPFSPSIVPDKDHGLVKTKEA